MTLATLLGWYIWAYLTYCIGTRWYQDYVQKQTGVNYCAPLAFRVLQVSYA